jgi:hypothetical protein
LAKLGYDPGSKPNDYLPWPLLATIDITNGNHLSMQFNRCKRRVSPSPVPSICFRGIMF